MAYRVVELKNTGRGYQKIVLDSNLSLQDAQSKVNTYVVNNPGIFISIEAQ